MAETCMELCGIMASIVNSVNLVTSAVENLWVNMNANINVIMVDTTPDVPPKPVDIPARFQFEDMDIFTSTGVDRFKQEVQSANEMLRQLNATQDAMAKKVYNSPDPSMDGWQELNSMAVRLDLIRERMQKIEGSRLNLGASAANSELERLRTSLYQAVGEQKELNEAINEMDVSAANSAYERLAKTVGGMEQYLRDNVDEQGNFNKVVEAGLARCNAWKDKVKEAVASFANIQNIGKAMDLSDQLAGAAARLNTINDGIQSTQELMDMVHWAAQDARVSFFDMEKAVTSLGENTNGTFGSTEETVAFADLVQKQMTMAGMTPEDASGAMQQLSAAIGSGTLGENEMNGVLGKAPGMIHNIADYLGVSTDQVHQIASEGGISAETLKAAIFAASDDINKKFEEFPITWGQIWGKMQGGALGAFSPVLQKLNDFANSEMFQTFVTGAITAMTVLANITSGLLDLIGTVGGFIAENWSIISPIIYGIIAALLVYVAYMGIVKAIELAGAIIKGVMTVAAFLHAVAMTVLATATASAAGAQRGLNGAMSACPIVWIIILIIALIAIIFVVCNAIAEMTGIANSGFGVIAGGINVVITFFKNLALTMVNIALGIGKAIRALAINMVTAFRNAICSVQSWFYDLLSTALSVVEKICIMLNKLPFVDFNYSGISSAAQDYANKANNAAAQKKKYIDIYSEFMNGATTFTTFEDGWIADAFNEGALWGDSIADKVGSFDLSDLGNNEDKLNFDDYPYETSEAIGDSNVGDNLGTIAENTGSSKDSLDCATEDLKYLRDIAEQEAVNRFTMAEVKVEQTNHNNINNGMDLDGVVSGLTSAVNEAVDNITEGVHG